MRRPDDLTQWAELRRAARTFDQAVRLWPHHRTAETCLAPANPRQECAWCRAGGVCPHAEPSPTDVTVALTVLLTVLHTYLNDERDVDDALSDLLDDPGTHLT